MGWTGWFSNNWKEEEGRGGVARIPLWGKWEEDGWVYGGMDSWDGETWGERDLPTYHLAKTSSLDIDGGRKYTLGLRT